MGLRMRDSASQVTTRVYFSSDWKKSTSSTGMRRTFEPTEALIQRRCSAGRAAQARREAAPPAPRARRARGEALLQPLDGERRGAPR